MASDPANEATPPAVAASLARATPGILVSIAAAAFFLARFAPAWVVAMLVPLAVLFALLDRRIRANEARERLAALTRSVAGIGADTPAAAGDEPPPARRDPFDELAARIAARTAWIARAMAREAEARATLRAYLNAVDTPIIATDDAGRIDLLNRAAERLFETRPSRAVGVPLEEVLTNSALLELHARAESGEACRDRIRLTFRRQARIYEVSAIPVRLDIADIPASVAQRSGVVLTLRDVHELAQTLQLRTDFAANASHELRTPIAAIRGAVDTMRGAASDDPAMIERLVRMIDGNVARLEEMVADLLDLSRLESDEQEAEAEAIDALELAETLGAMFESACRARSLTLAFDLDPRLARMRTDRKLLLLILRNLIDNATKFAFEHTEIRVTGAVEPGAGPLASARFAVADQGVGIPLKHQERIFERFFQVDGSRTRAGSRRGSGLGLAIVRHAVRRLDGEIRVESVWQEGTTMTFTLPGCVEPGPVATRPVQAGPVEAPLPPLGLTEPDTAPPEAATPEPPGPGSPAPEAPPATAKRRPEAQSRPEASKKPGAKSEPEAKSGSNAKAAPKRKRAPGPPPGDGPRPDQPPSGA